MVGEDDQVTMGLVACRPARRWFQFFGRPECEPAVVKVGRAGRSVEHPQHGPQVLGECETAACLRLKKTAIRSGCTEDSAKSQRERTELVEDVLDHGLWLSG